MKPTITNLQGEKKVLSGFANMKRTKRVNGEKELSFTLYRTRANDAYFDDIGELWTVGFLGDEYKVLLTSDDADGNDYQREFSCVHTFYDTLRNIPIEEERSKTMSFNECLSFILADAPFQFNIQGEFPSREFENFGVSDACDLFLEAMERYGAEFTVEGPVITLVPEIGRDTDFQYRYKFNVNSVNREIDAVDLATVGIGLGKVDEDTGERLARVEYRSPLADVYGEGRKVIIEDKRFTIEDNLLEKVKEEVDNSLKTSITFKFHDLRDQGYDRARPEEGDRVFLVDGRMGLKLRTRMVEIEEWFNAHLDVIDCDVTLSNFDNVENQQRRQEKTIKAISDAIEGKKPMKLEWLSDVVQFTTDKLQSFETEFTILSNGSVLAVDKNDPNNVMLYTAGGVGISTDGGNTYDNALTARGLNATAIWTGTIRTGNVRIEGSRGLFYIDDEAANWVDPVDGNNRLRITPEGLQISSDGGNTWVTRVTGQEVMANRVIAGVIEGSVIRSSTFEGLEGNYINFGPDGPQIDYSASPDSGSLMIRTKANDVNYIGVVQDSGDVLFFMDTPDGSPAFRFHSTGDGHYAIDSGEVQLKFLAGTSSRIQARKGNGEYAIFEASDFVVASREGMKKNIEPLAYSGEDSALQRIVGTNIYRYHYKTDDDRELKRTGVMYEESPDEIIDPGGAGVSGQAMAALAWKAIQEQQDELDALRARVEMLENG